MGQDRIVLISVGTVSVGGKGEISVSDYLHSVYAEVLNHKRPLTLPMMRRLHQGLGIPAEVLIAESVAA